VLGRSNPEPEIHQLFQMRLTRLRQKGSTTLVRIPLVDCARTNETTRSHRPTAIGFYSKNTRFSRKPGDAKDLENPERLNV
jgi:hypothetical protein